MALRRSVNVPIMVLFNKRKSPILITIDVVCVAYKNHYNTYEEPIYYLI
jgi:hypothetical protein